MEVVDIDVTLHALHPGQRRLQKALADHRFMVAVLGRRWGKTFFAVNDAFEKLISTPGLNAMWVSPTFDLCTIAWDEWHRFIPLELFKPNKTEHTIKLVNGSTFWFRSADKPDSLIGRGLDLLYIDEAARISADAIDRALLPAIADRNGRVLAITTPMGKRNWVYKWYRKGVNPDPEYAQYGALQGSSTENPNPLIAEWVREMAPKDLGGRGGMPRHIFEQEILAQFLDDAAAVFRNIAACSLNQKMPAWGQSPDRVIAMGVDIAKHRDYTVIMGISRDDNGRKKITQYDRFHRIPWPLQKKRIKKRWEQAGKPTLWLDTTGVGDPIRDDLIHMGVRVNKYHFTNETKGKVIDSLSVDIEAGDLRWPKIASFEHELEAYSYTITPIGHFKYGAPEGEHDDNVIAAALANHGAKKASMPIVRF